MQNTASDLSTEERGEGARGLGLPVLFGAGVAVIAADLVLKQVAIDRWSAEPVTFLGGLVALTEGRNAGAAFGIAASWTPLLAVLSLLVVVAIAASARRLAASGFALAAGLVLGGASGNLVDRLFRAPGFMRGHVVDWLDVGAWPTFNLADASLVVGCVLFVVRSARKRR